MLLSLDSRTQLISLGFKELLNMLFEDITVEWHVGKPEHTVKSDEEPKIVVYNFNDNYPEIENDLILTGEDTSSIKVVLIIGGDISNLHKLVTNGVSGFIDMNASIKELKVAFEKILHNQNYYCELVWNKILHPDEELSSTNKYNLTKREIEIVESLLNGKSTLEISSDLGLSPHTVQTHRKNCFKKLEVKSLSELLLFEIKNQVFKK
jgi:DNA-binding NarL/FixJ family response regulator